MSQSLQTDTQTHHEVAATISLEAASAVFWQAVVIGAGPAGSAAALRLAARALRVLLVDATTMPRPKLCGCCLSTHALHELGLLARLAHADAAADIARHACSVPPPEAHPTPATRSGPGLCSMPAGTQHEGLPAGSLRLRSVCLATRNGTAVMPMPGGSIISREALDSAGVRGAIAAGVAWLPSTRDTAITEESTSDSAAGVRLSAMPNACGDSLPLSITAEIVVVAAGLVDAIRSTAGSGDRDERVITPQSRVGLGTTLPATAGGPSPGELVMAVAQRGYCGIVCLEDGRVDVAAAIDRGAVAEAGSPAAAIAAILAQSGGDHAANLRGSLAAELLAAATFRGTPPLTRQRPVASSSGRILRVGDAAGYVEPFTGEGIGWALASSRILDEVYLRAVFPGGHRAGDPAAAAISYHKAHQRHFAVHHARCRRVSLVVRRPWLVGSAIRLARLAPAVAARVVPLVVGAVPPQKARG